MEIALLIVAAGRGTRAGGSRPKQYQKIMGQTLLLRTIRNLMKCQSLNPIKVVINENDYNLYQRVLSQIDRSHAIDYCYGGKDRSDSVFCGLRSLSKLSPIKVLIHDAARPFTSLETIQKIIRHLDEYDAVFPALPIVDALWKIEDSFVSPGINRTNLFRAQTPQGFEFKKILQAYRKNENKVLDDVEVAFNAGLSIKTVEGSESNFKITTPEDFKRAERYI